MRDGRRCGYSDSIMAMTIAVLLLSGFLQSVPAPVPPVIDGRIDEQEWRGAQREHLAGDGDVYLLRRGEYLFIAVRGPKPGLASLCAAKGDAVRILHASAAVGEARYERAGHGWTRRQDFTWSLRDSPRGGPADADKAGFLSASGWLANANRAGGTEREFQVRASDVESLGVTFLSTDEPMHVSYWPSTMDDDCRSVKVPQGFLPDTAQFAPESWHRPAR